MISHSYVKLPEGRYCRFFLKVLQDRYTLEFQFLIGEFMNLVMSLVRNFQGNIFSSERGIETLEHLQVFLGSPLSGGSVDQRSSQTYCGSSSTNTWFIFQLTTIVAMGLYSKFHEWKLIHGLSSSSRIISHLIESYTSFICQFHNTWFIFHSFCLFGFI